jgi:hypothetical protein
MRKILILLPLLIGAAPAAAQPRPVQLPPELSNPATVQQLSTAAHALSDAVLDMPVGEMKAAVEGREPTPADRALTVRDLARRDDPNFDGDVHRKIATVGPALQRSVAAVNHALPAMMRALEQAQDALDRAVANLPDPTYPRR